MVEQYRRLHIHSKDSLKHIVLLKTHVLTVVKSTILYVLTQDLHWRHIYINIWKQNCILSSVPCLDCVYHEEDGPQH